MCQWLSETLICLIMSFNPSQRTNRVAFHNLLTTAMTHSENECFISLLTSGVYSVLIQLQCRLLQYDYTLCSFYKTSLINTLIRAELGEDLVRFGKQPCKVSLEQTTACLDWGLLDQVWLGQERSSHVTLNQRIGFSIVQYDWECWEKVNRFECHLSC